jgi:hypothetical protein
MSHFVTNAVSDQWTGIDCNEEGISEPRFSDLKRWIDRLDARTWTMISIFSSSGPTLKIGGGSGHYVVVMAPAEEEFWNLIRPAGEIEGDVRINVGGQEGEYSRRQVVGYPEALKATETFFSTG